MSDTKNKTENTEDTTTDTAPYMKKTGQDKNNTVSQKTDMLVPVVLVLISAIVIGTTFYGNKDQAAPAQEENTPAATAATEVETIAEAPAENASAAQEQAASNSEAKAAATEESDTQSVTDEQSHVADTETTPAVTEVIIVSKEKVAATAPQTPAASHMAAMRSAHVSAQTPYQYKPYDRQQAQARAKQRMEMLQKRRQAYEREMQDRHAQYEAAMKAWQEKRAKIADAKKAVFQRAQKDRQVIDHKIQEIHKQIAELHEEIHRLMSEYRRKATPAPMHSM